MGFPAHIQHVLDIVSNSQYIFVRCPSCFPNIEINQVISNLNLMKHLFTVKVPNKMAVYCHRTNRFQLSSAK